MSPLKPPILLRGAGLEKIHRKVWILGLWFQDPGVEIGRDRDSDVFVVAVAQITLVVVIAAKKCYNTNTGSFSNRNKRTNPTNSNGSKE